MCIKKIFLTTEKWIKKSFEVFGKTIYSRYRVQEPMSNKFQTGVAMQPRNKALRLLNQKKVA